MAIRELRVCDKMDGGDPCNGLYTQTCPLCGQDCCSGHISTELGLRLAVVIGSNRPLGSCVVAVCSHCFASLNPPMLPPPAPPHPHQIQPGPFPGGAFGNLLQAPGPMPPFPPPPSAIQLAAPIPQPFDEFTRAHMDPLLEVTRAYLAAQALSNERH